MCLSLDFSRFIILLLLVLHFLLEHIVRGDLVNVLIWTAMLLLWGEIFIVLDGFFLDLSGFVDELAVLIFFDCVRLVVLFGLFFDLVVYFLGAEADFFVLGAHDCVSVLQENKPILQLTYVILLRRQFS